MFLNTPVGEKIMAYSYERKEFFSPNFAERAGVTSGIW